MHKRHMERRKRVKNKHCAGLVLGHYNSKTVRNGLMVELLSVHGCTTVHMEEEVDDLESFPWTKYNVVLVSAEYWRSHHELFTRIRQEVCGKECGCHRILMVIATSKEEFASLAKENGHDAETDCHRVMRFDHDLSALISG